MFNKVNTEFYIKKLSLLYSKNAWKTFMIDIDLNWKKEYFASQLQYNNIIRSHLNWLLNRNLNSTFDLDSTFRDQFLISTRLEKILNISWLIKNLSRNSSWNLDSTRQELNYSVKIVKILLRKINSDEK